MPTEHELDHTGMLIELTRGQATLVANVNSLKESMDKYAKESTDQMEKGMKFLYEEGEKKQKSIDSLEDKHNELDKKVSRQSGIAIGISSTLSLITAGLTAWWTGHSNH